MRKLWTEKSQTSQIQATVASTDSQSSCFQIGSSIVRDCVSGCRGERNVQKFSSAAVLHVWSLHQQKQLLGTPWKCKLSGPAQTHGIKTSEGGASCLCRGYSLGATRCPGAELGSQREGMGCRQALSITHVWVISSYDVVLASALHSLFLSSVLRPPG